VGINNSVMSDILLSDFMKEYIYFTEIAAEELLRSCLLRSFSSDPWWRRWNI